MFKCLQCGHLFEDGEQLEWEDMHGLTFGNGEHFSGCPLCKGDYQEIEPCKICGTYQHEVEDEYCEDCKNNIEKRFSDFIEKEFTDEERKLLNELYEDKPI